MFKISTWKTAVRASLFFVFATVFTVMIAKYAIERNNLETNAATGNNERVWVGSEGTATYGENTTELYYIFNRLDQKFRAYCAEPEAFYPAVGDWEGGPGMREIDSVYADENNNNNKIKLMIYLFENRSDNTAKNALNVVFQDWGWEGKDLEAYGWTHAIIGYIYANQLPETGGDWVRTAATKLGELISNNNPAWAIAQHYQLHIGEGRDLGDGHPKRQDVVWIESTYASIKIQKLDSDTNSATPQGNASLAGIHFELVRTSDNVVVADGLTAADGTLAFPDQLVGASYKVREKTDGSTNRSYTIGDSDSSEITLNDGGYTFNVKDSVKRGNVTVIKVDEETQSCENKTSELGFEGVQFQIINNSTNPVVINNQRVAKGGVIYDNRPIDLATCSVTFENLPYGDYLIKETQTSAGYKLNETPIEVTIPTNSKYEFSVKFGNQPIRGDLKFRKMDKNSNVPMDNTLFSISALDKNNNIKETHLVVSDQNGVVDTSLIPHSQNTNGYDALYDAGDSIIYRNFGTWFGLDSNGHALEVNDDLGALPYGTYIIQELKCDANFFCNNIMNQKKTIQITTANQVVDLGDWDNTCAEFELLTKASDEKDGDSVIEEGKEVTIKDEIEYCAKANMNFTIKGTLMDKSTGEPLLVDGEPVESEIALKPDTDCGKIDMFFTFDATDLGGKELVVFEKLYFGEDLLTSHEDIDDEDQTVYVFKLTTIARNKDTLDKVLPLDQDVVIEDLVKYCVIPGHKYRFHGILMDKNTGNGVLVDSKSVEQSVVVEPEEACGELVMEYPINTTGFGGAELVIFESLYLIEDDEPEEGDEPEEIEIISHRDFNDEDETVRVELPAPDTGYITKTGDDGTISNYTLFFAMGSALLGFGGYFIFRKLARRKVMRF